ncbi:hypothetical protein BpHYR1_045144, partial [Brachionus plicatilis]
ENKAHLKKSLLLKTRFFTVNCIYATGLCLDFDLKEKNLKSNLIFWSEDYETSYFRLLITTNISIRKIFIKISKIKTIKKPFRRWHTFSLTNLISYPGSIVEDFIFSLAKISMSRKGRRVCLIGQDNGPSTSGVITVAGFIA